MGTAMFYQRRFDDAIATFQESLSSNPTDAQTLFNLGVTMLHGKNDPKAAVEYWQRMLDANPNHPQAALVRDQIQKLKEQPKEP
jgi:cytochrome c-type biogenesis protein CcmH/NrfG